MFADPQNDVDYRVGHIQHTLNSCVGELLAAADRGDGHWIVLTGDNGLITARLLIDGLLERLQRHNANAA